MDPLFVIIPTIAVVSFGAGILFSKVVLAEAVTVKQHVTDAAASTKQFVTDSEKRIVLEVSAVKSQLEYLKKI